MLTPLRLLTGLLGTTVALTASCMMDLDGLPGSTTTGASPASGGGSSEASSAGSGGAGGASASSASGSSSVASASSTGSTSSAGSSSGTGGGVTMIKVAGELLVDLDVDDQTAGTAIWHNKGTLSGDFLSKGSPTKGLNGGKSSVLFNGSSDAYYGPQSKTTIEGKDSRTIELWVFNQMVSNTEETMLSWSDRKNQSTGKMMSFNYGKNLAFSAVTHWNQADMAWGPNEADSPSEAHWHHLVYTYDGTKAIVFADGVNKAEKTVPLDTKGGFSINLAVQRNGNGFERYGSLAIAIARVHSDALAPADVKFNYDAEKPRFP
jgi:Concanavalin A-like lectin/glucanases superfamily